MEKNDWLKLLLEQMQSDLDEIKADIKTLQHAKFKFEGAVLVLSAIVSGVISLLSLYFKA